MTMTKYDKQLSRQLQDLDEIIENRIRSIHGLGSDCSCKGNQPCALHASVVRHLRDARRSVALAMDALTRE